MFLLKKKKTLKKNIQKKREMFSRLKNQKGNLSKEFKNVNECKDKNQKINLQAQLEIKSDNLYLLHVILVYDGDIRSEGHDYGKQVGHLRNKCRILLLHCVLEVIMRLKSRILGYFFDF